MRSCLTRLPRCHAASLARSLVFAWALASISPGWSAPSAAHVDRVVILKVDGLPENLIERYARESRPRLPRIAAIFGQDGAWFDNFYTRGISLSAPSWSMLDTGRHLQIHGNVEYDRYTLRPWDYLNFFPFYVGYARSKHVDMPGVELLDQQDVPLLIDRFPYDQRYQSFQLLQRGIRWSTLESTLTGKFASRPLKDLFDEWQTGFSMSSGVNEATEKDVLRELKDPNIRYLDLFTGEYDHVAHLTSDRVAQLHVLQSLDALAGRLWTAIATSPYPDSTLLVLVSDHGMNTSESTFSQGYNLVDWFTSEAGGAHHVITDRHPLTEFKLKGLDPFVSEVVTPSSESSYLAGKSDDYPTAVLDLDGNERANIALRENSLNIVHILLTEMSRRRLTGPLRVAALAALFEEIDRQRPLWTKRLDDLHNDLADLSDRIAKQQRAIGAQPSKWSKTDRDAGLDKDARREAEVLERWKSELHADSEYAATLERLLALTPADFDPGKFKIEELIPRKSLGGLNSIHDLQNYVTGPAPGGLVLNAEGSLDWEKSFHRTDYFSALSSISVRNNVQKYVAPRPVDFIALRVPGNSLAAALRGAGNESAGFDSIEDGIWLYKNPEQQALILTRRNSAGRLDFRYLPVANLTQDQSGAVHFERCEWTSGLPLEMFEDPAIEVPKSWLAEWHDEREWFTAVHASKYSNGIVGLTEQLLDHPGADLADNQAGQRRLARLRTDLLVFANDHWNFNVRGFNPGGNHGSLLQISTHSVLLVVGGKNTGIPRGVRIATPYDSLSFVPTILKLIGKPEPDLPGPLIDELFSQ